MGHWHDFIFLSLFTVLWSILVCGALALVLPVFGKPAALLGSGRQLMWRLLVCGSRRTRMQSSKRLGELQLLKWKVGVS
jgi:hypothetical protein